MSESATRTAAASRAQVNSITLVEKGAVVSVVVICLWAGVALWDTVVTRTSEPVAFVAFGLEIGVLAAAYLAWTDAPGYEAFDHAVMLAFIALGLAMQQAALAYAGADPHDKLQSRIAVFDAADCETIDGQQNARATIRCRPASGAGMVDFASFGSPEQAQLALNDAIEQARGYGFKKVDSLTMPAKLEYSVSPWWYADKPSVKSGHFYSWRDDKDRRGAAYVDGKVYIRFSGTDAFKEAWPGLKH